MRINRYWQVWKLQALNAVQITFVNRGTNALFFLGKIIRLAMSLALLYLIRENVSAFSGYSVDEMIVFFLMYQFIDVSTQAVFRAVYRFGREVRTGEFDFTLIRPINPLFQSLLGYPDINDIIMMIFSTGLSVFILFQLDITLTVSSVVFASVLIINGFLISAGLHILVLATAILTTEIDGIVWLYRDLTRLGQFPITIYTELLRFALFFIVPVGIMITLPAQVLLNTKPTVSLPIACGIGIAFFLISVLIWKKSIEYYSSASS